MVETLGEALRASWRIRARCVDGYIAGERIARKCRHVSELDLETLVWTRGANFPLSRLDGRLKCPRCGSLRVAVIFEPPAGSAAARA